MMRYLVYTPDTALVVCGRAVLTYVKDGSWPSADGTYHWEFWLEPTGLKIPGRLGAQYRACMFKSVREADDAALALQMLDYRVRTLNL